MGIIFVNLKAMENRDNLNVKPQGDTELEKAQYVYEYIKKANDIVFDGVIVTEYGAIIKLIHETYKYESRTTEEYWQDKISKDTMVYMMFENIVLSFDYFLYQEKKVSDFYKCRTYTEVKFNFIFRTDIKEVKKIDIIKDVLELEKLDGISTYDGGKKQADKDEITQERNKMKKILFTDKAGVAKKLEQYLGIKEDKISKENRIDYYKMVFLLYYLDKHGIEYGNKQFQRIKILDSITKPRLQLVANFLEHTNIPEPAEELELLKNEIVKHLSLNQINRINRIYVQLIYCYETTFQYIGKLLDVPINVFIEERELTDIENRVDKCMEAIKNVQEYEQKHTYEDSVWEIGYLKYKAFIRRCEREDSYKSLKYAYDLGKPVGKMLFEQTADPKIRFYEVPKTGLADFIKRESEWFAESISGKCTKRWVQNHTEDIVKLCSIMERFFRRTVFDGFPLTMVIASAQALYEAKTKKLVYENNYKGYYGNKAKSLYASLKNIDVNENTDAFDYAWTALIKRWCNYNEIKYGLYEHSVRIDLKFTELIRKVVELDSVSNIDIFVEGMFAELGLPQEYRMTGIKQKVQQEIQELSGYELIIEDMRILREFEHENFIEYFCHELTEIIQFNEYQYDENIFQFHYNMRYMAVKFEQNKEEGKIRLLEMKYLQLGNQYNMFQRAIELKLPWFTEDFTDF